MAPRYRITLSNEERTFLNDITHNGKNAAKKITRAHVLLLCDAGEYGPAKKVDDVAKTLGITDRTIEHLKKRFVEEGLEAALETKERAPRKPVKFDGKFEAQLVALACSEAPEGHARWTLKLLAEKVVELNYTTSISEMQVGRILKKMKLSLI